MSGSTAIVASTPRETRGTAVVRESRWLAASGVAVGLVNYAYSLLLTQLLAPRAFADFAAAQSLLLVCGTLATSSMPWVVARVLSEPGTSEQARRQVIWFSVVVNLLQGLLAAAVLCLIGSRFLSPSSLVAVASRDGRDLPDHDTRRLASGLPTVRPARVLPRARGRREAGRRRGAGRRRSTRHWSLGRRGRRRTCGRSRRSGDDALRAAPRAGEPCGCGRCGRPASATWGSRAWSRCSPAPTWCSSPSWTAAPRTPAATRLPRSWAGSRSSWPERWVRLRSRRSWRAPGRRATCGAPRSRPTPGWRGRTPSRWSPRPPSSSPSSSPAPTHSSTKCCRGRRSPACWWGWSTWSPRSSRPLLSTGRRSGCWPSPFPPTSGCCSRGGSWPTSGGSRSPRLSSLRCWGSRCCGTPSLGLPRPHPPVVVLTAVSVAVAAAALVASREFPFVWLAVAAVVGLSALRLAMRQRPTAGSHRRRTHV